MTEARNSRVLRTIPLLLMVMLFFPFAYSKVIHVDDDGQADFDNIQAGIDAAEYGDTVCVAPGTYHENITLRNGINLLGAGANVTIIDANRYGDVVDARANNVTICGFTLRNSGEFDLRHMNCGVYLNGSYAPIVKNNVIVNNRIGIGVWYGANPDIINNIIQNNSNGLYIYGSEESPSNPGIINNTIVNNEINGIILREMVSPIIVNNIIVGHITGINHNYVTVSPTLSYNNLWHNDVNYMRDNGADDTLAGPGSISVDPYFAENGYWADVNDPNIVVVKPNDQNAVLIDGDYHLKSQFGRYNPNTQTWVVDDVTSPCIDAGDPNRPVAFEPFPNGGLVNMGAYGGTAEASKSPSGLHAKYSGGTGEPNDPYRIATAEDLILLGESPEDYDKHFILTADIDLDPNLPGRKVFDKAVIASFTGVLDGNGYTIWHLTVKGGTYLALFGELRTRAEVRDLGIADVNITASDDYIGGLVGTNGGALTGCHSTGVVTGRTDVGGLVGENWGTVAQCYSACAVSGGNGVGGLMGANSNGTVSNCYSNGPVRGTGWDGGLMAYNLGVVIHCFWDIQTSGQTTSAGGTGKTTAQMQTASTFLEAGWDFVSETANGTQDIWWILEGKDYPRLTWELVTNELTEEQGQP